MSRVTIDFGIDLGTTNSEICVLKGIKPESIRNNLNSAITPSAVYLSKHGGITVGAQAKERLEDEKSTNDVQIEFKRRMGTDFSYKFLTTGRTMNPKDLSAEVLKSLRGDVQQQLGGEIINAAVITVPAAFEQRQCAATREAAALAGFLQSPLLQEPVAAALAYGFQADVQKEHWLVFDFGGGTFDAALIKAEDGTITVENHGGDNFLGGADIDWAIFKEIVLPQIQSGLNLKGLTRGAEEWKTQLAIVKRSIENAKILLSRQDKSYLEDCCIKDAEGKEHEIELEITRDQVISVAEPIILRAIDICKKVLKDKKLSTEDIGKLILVGGPTLAPYFREILKSNLPISIDFSVDPMTVVAQGAAIFAGGQRLEGDAAPKAIGTQFNVKLIYNPIGPDEDPRIQGKVSSPTGVSIDGFTIELVQQKNGWRSGKIPLKDGSFKAVVLAEKGYPNEYAVELCDATGIKQETVPDRFTYTIGASSTEQNLPVTIPISMVDNTVDSIFKKGDPLPNKATRVYKSTCTVIKGDASSKLNIPVVEGENYRADRNRLLGTFVVSGDMIKRDIPAGADVELVVTIDASRVMRLKAFIPVLDEEYEAKIDYNQHSPDVDVLKKGVRAEKSRLEEIKSQVETNGGKSDKDLLRAMEQRINSVDELLSNAGDPDAASQAEIRLLELRVGVDQLEDSMKFPTMLKEVQDVFEKLSESVEEAGTPTQKSMVAKWREELDSIAEAQDADRLRRLQGKILDMHRGFLQQDPDFWKGFLVYLYEKRSSMRDQVAAERLFSLGVQHIESNNVPGMASVGRQLLQLLPPEEAAAAQGGYGSTIVQ